MVGSVSRATLEAETRSLQQQLQVASQHASMAEVATGALHNIGNVLNSVSVSASLVENRMRQSRVGNLSKALALLRDHRGDLAAFLSQDPKGKMLPGYLESLAQYLVAEQAEMLREMVNLTKNLEHIKEIVSVQQSYSRQCGTLETLEAAELVQDALRMNLGSFERHGILVSTDFASVPLVTVDRHKVLQILINLMRNAKYAMDELQPSERRLVLGIARKGEDRIIISVRDNGAGIAPKILARIFERGFTTKRDGHGFGLSSGILAAREMGGDLSAHSDGLGCGATFCLELPIASQPPVNSHNGNGATHNQAQR